MKINKIEIIKRKLFTIIMTSVTLISFSQDYFIGGCLIDTVGENMILKEDMPITRGGLPSSISLKKYVPTIKSQGNISSCTGWATTYAAFTIIRRLETGIGVGPFSPLSTYNKIKTDDYPNELDCDRGSWPKDALNLLVKQGSPYYKDYTNSCRLDDGNNPYEDKLYRFRTLNCNEEQGVNNIKSALNNNEPVVISMKVYNLESGRNSLNDKYVSSRTGEWTFDVPAGDPNNYSTSGHALCIIGYDDNKFGGSFEVMNSWGDDWGNSGFFWVKYSDIRTIYRGYSLVPKDVNSNMFTTNHIEYENKTNKDLFIAISYTGFNGKITRGWYKVRPFSTTLVDISERDKNPIYWFATESYHNWYNIGSADFTDLNGEKMTIENSNSFQIHKNKSTYYAKNKGGIKFVPDEKQNVNNIVISKRQAKQKGYYHKNYGEEMINTNIATLLNGDINVEYEYMYFNKNKDCFTESVRIPFRFKYLNYDKDGVTDILRTGLDYRYFLNQKRSKTKYFLGIGEHLGMSIEKDVANDFRKRYFFNETLVSTGVSYQLSSYINLTFDVSSGWGLRNFSNSYIPFNYGLKVGYRY